MILAGDIGGTKTALGIFEPAPGAAPTLLARETYPSGAHPSLEAIITIFLAGPGARARGALRAAAFGVAGPVMNGEARITNLPWVIREEAIRGATGAPIARLLNDLETTAYGMLLLSPAEFRELNPGSREPLRGNVAVIAAGTGLGEAMLWWDGALHHAVASEGGHADFAPRNDIEDGLLRFLRAEFPDHVSVERVLSGPGIHNIYRYLLASGRANESAATAARMRLGDPNAAIAAAALRGDDPLASATLDLFASIYGAEAGNLALRVLATGGVMVGGGIAPHILAVLESGLFMTAFTAKGRFRAFMTSLPVRVSLPPDASLAGAAHAAARLAGGPAPR